MTEETEVIQEASYSDLFSYNLDRFLDEISALNDTLPIQMILLSVKKGELLKKLESISTDKEEGKQDGKEFVKFKIKKDKFDELPKIHKHIKRTELALKIIPRNYIVSIISQYDAYLGELVRILYQINPNLIRASEKELTVDDLFQYESIDELKSHIVDKEVDSLLREEHLEQLKILERRITKVSKKDFTLTTNLPILPCFIELTQRRNLFVHTNGLTTRQYLDAKRKWNFTSECNGQLNEELIAEPNYCRTSYEILYEMAVKLTHVLWRKFAPEQRYEADVHLNQISYELLIDNKYDLAKTVCAFATDIIKKFSSEQIRKFMVINRAIAHKMKKEEDECKQVLKSEDWSIGNEFKLANYVLEDKFDKAKEMMIKIGDNDEILNKQAYKEWPLFKLFRKSDEFLSGYQEVFNEEFILEEVQDKKVLNKKYYSDEEE